jgi:hypothetical protein
MSKAKSKSKSDAKQMTRTPISTAVRAVALTLGFVLGGLGAYGAYQLQASMDGPASYLAFAAPAIVISGLLIPCFAVRAWQAGHKVMSIALWAVLIPAGAVEFYSAAERVHASKAGAAAELSAAGDAAVRAKADLAEAKVAADKATVTANKVRGLEGKACTAKCLSIRASETAARGRVSAAETALRHAQGQAVAEAQLKAPVWLLPTALILVAFMLVSFGADGKRVQAKAEPAKARAKQGKRLPKPKSPAPKAPTQRIPKAPTQRVVVPIRAA